MIIYSEHAFDILNAATVLADEGKRFALIVSLNIEGGAARSIGSLAIVDVEGQMNGYLSNGCVDRDIIIQSLEALQNETVKHVRYGAGSQYMDIRLPCGGALEIMIDPAPDLSVLRQAFDALRQRQSAVLTFSQAHGLVAQSAGVNPSDKQFTYAPKPRLLLVGRGAIMLTTAKLATQMDFELVIASPDQDDLAILSALEPALIYRMTGPRQAFDVEIDAHSAVLLLFHDHEWEEAVLMSCARQNPFFLGAMGSQKTHALRLAGLQAAGLEEAHRTKIRGPIGLVPSLRNASLIAVSALAEVVANLPPSQCETQH